LQELILNITKILLTSKRQTIYRLIQVLCKDVLEILSFEMPQWASQLNVLELVIQQTKETQFLGIQQSQI